MQLAPDEAAARHRGGKFLTLRLGGVEYAVDVLRVQEIRSYERPTRIANAPPFIKGVVKLHGSLVPIIDLRSRLGGEGVQVDDFSVVIVLEAGGCRVGAIVDSVSDVLQLGRDSVKPAPAASPGPAHARFIAGVAHVAGDGHDRVLILLDIDALVSNATAEVEAAA